MNYCGVRLRLKLSLVLFTLIKGGDQVELGIRPVSGRPTNLGNSRARAYCACSRCERGLFGDFFYR